MFEKIKKIFWGIFLLPDYALTFLSGIFVAVSVNILTSQIPQSIFEAGWTFFIAAILLFVMAGIFLLWSATIKPIQQEYNESTDIRESIGTLNCWYNFINRKTCQALSAKKKLVFFFLLIVVLFVVSLILLLFPENIKAMINCFSSAINKVED